jgi:Family of unknown function (DUF6338)
MPSTLEALVIVALVLAPGYVLSLFAGEVIAFARKDQTDTAALLPTITCGTLVHAVLSPWTLRVLDYYRVDSLTNHSTELVLWGIFLILIAPALMGIAAGQISNVDLVDRVLDKIGLGYIDRMPSAWDYVLRKEEPAFVRIYLSGGVVIGGAFSTNSFGSTTADRTDIYLEKAWEMDSDGKFVQPLAGSSGVWVTHNLISHVEFFDALEVNNDENAQNN